MKKVILILFTICLLYYSCIKENENYIEKIDILTYKEGPSPDDIVFSLHTSRLAYEAIEDDNINRYILEADDSIYINYTNLGFGIEKLPKNKIEFHFLTSYFISNRKRFNFLSDEALKKKLNNSKSLKLKLFVGDKVFEFKNK